MKRTPLQRTKPLVRTEGPAKAEIKPKKCKACRAPFFPASPWQTHCRAEACAVAAAEAAHEKRARTLRKQSQAERKADKAKRESLQTIPDLIDKAQHAFNRYVRLRDNGRGCISCGTPLSLGGVGGGFDCGHYRSRGAAGHLRFHEHNAHGQCKRCNRRLSGNVSAFRLGLLDRIGLPALEALEADNAQRKWTRDELREIAAKYRTKARELERQERMQPSPASGAYLGACII